ncbi:phosphoethanolamine--lipid A transferase [Rhizobium lemnae]|uniref:Phosphoethanolamine transferase n=1 Tax=Rhizobium lemnae TaxID=1214924 RepID=A0ABV8EG18_9HYPH|nr:phosphoethanolamine--lipid A transferase [Rhizobium lemnae]MCJ8510675.1 phosphoethanolamine--lipid A transferase [Rhizobium lemnae]
MTFKRPILGSILLSIIVSVYILLLLNRTFWAKTFDIMAGQNLAIAAFAIGITFAFIALFVSFSVKYLMKPLLIVFIWTAASSAWFMDQFGVIIDDDMIRNAAETNTAEASHLITAGFILHMCLYALLPSLLIAWVKIRHRNFFSKVVRNLAVIIPSLVIFAVAGLSHAGIYSFARRQNHDWFEMLNPVFPMINAVTYVRKATAEKNIVVKPLGRDAKVADALKASHRKPRVTIVVVGETARASSFQLGGYERPTNPELSKRDIFYFTKATSCGTATAISVPCMFSNLGQNGYAHAKALAQENLMDVLVHAGVRTEWLDNNTGSKGVADRILYSDLFNSNDARFCNGGECWDDILLDRLDGWLKTVSEDAVLVLHQLGSHGPAYYARYPDAFKIFQPDCRSSEFSKCHRDEIINAYDNTIVYTDHVLASIIDKLSAQQDRLSPSMIYMSDHGESLGEKGLFLHGAPWLVAPEQQTHIPFVLWLGDEARRGIESECIDRLEKEPVSHDNLFHTVLGLMHVETKVKDPKLDIYGSCKASNAKS